MEAEIGSAAGTIWRYLSEHGETSLARLRRGTNLGDQQVLMGLGWLAREGKLRFARAARAVTVDLRRGDDS
jgi:hypothetical protein